MTAGADGVAEFGQQVAHAAMGMNVIGSDAQRGLEVVARLLVIVGQEQEVGEIDTSVGIVRMMTDGLLNNELAAPL